MTLILLCSRFIVFDFRTINNFIAGSSNKYDKGIKANTDKAVSLAKADLKAQNSGKDFIGSILYDLGTFLKTRLVPPLTGVSNAIPILKETISGALEGGSDGLKDGNLLNGVLGTVGGLTSGLTTGSLETTAKIGINTLKG